MHTTGDLYIEAHSLFYKGTAIKPSRSEGTDVGGLQVLPSAAAGGLGGAAAGAGCALCAADAMRRTAVLRGWRGCGYLLPPGCLPCM